jgi:PleD family two-component response regulator
MKKILVIEDDEPIRESIVEILQYEDYDAIGAHNGITGLQLAQDFQPDLIICDVMMPGLDGYEVLARLRKVSSLALTPFIFLTAKSGMEDLRYGMDLGADDYLTKPVKSTDLLNAVTIRLDRRSAMEAIYGSDLRRIQDQLNYVIYYDRITGLPNRFLLREKLASILAASDTINNVVPILLLNLDRFKRIRETFGQDAGDRVLQEVANRLLACVSENDMVAVLEKDEFVIILDAVDAKGEAHNVAEAAMSEITQPF